MPQNKQVDVSNLKSCVEEVRRAALDSDPGPAEPTDYQELRARLDASAGKLPPLYRQSAFTPYVSTLDGLGPTGFQQVLLSDPRRERAAGLMLDIAQAILQNGERYQEAPTDAFQEVVSDLYDGFLSAEDRQGVKPPDQEVLPALVKWGNPDFGPYTWPADATKTFGLKVAIVSLPPSNATSGILAWSALGHETAGHDVIHADDGLDAELAQAVEKGLEANPEMRKLGLPQYWADRIDETASDVMGILNMGPAAGIGLIGYFRGLNAAFGGSPRLRTEGSADDPHPVDLLRGYLAAKVVALLEFDLAADWSKAIRAETDKDAPSGGGTLDIGGSSVSLDLARQSAEKVAEILTTTPLQSLENHGLIQIQNWRNSDEDVATSLGTLLTSVGAPPPYAGPTFYAAHVVAAAVRIALAGGEDLAVLFNRMIGLLKRMHDDNPSWGPLFVAHPGNLYRHRSYVPHAAA